MTTRVLSAIAAAFALSLLACGGSGGSGGDDPEDLRGIGGAISGLEADGLVLQLNGREEVTLASGDTSFQFQTRIAGGSAYAVAIAQQPGNMTCSFDGNSGQGFARGSNVEIKIRCSRSAFRVGGAATGLAGPGLVLSLNGVALNVAASGPFTFPGALASGTSYVVSVMAAPAHQECQVVNGSGQIGGADVTDVAVTCQARTYHVSGSVSGLAGSGLELSLNGSALPITESTFTFPGTVAEGATYTVAVTRQPSNPTQVCSIGGVSSGAISADVTLTVACSTPSASTSSYHVSGLASGLAGPGLVLSLDGASLNVDASGSFTFPGPVASGTSFQVSVIAAPAHQTCEVVNGSGQIGGADVTDVQVVCQMRTYHVGGSVSGLAGSGLVLSLNGNALPISGSTFTFPNAIAEGATYTVTVTLQPSGPTQVCSIVGPSVGSILADVSLTVACSTSR